MQFLEVYLVVLIPNCKLSEQAQKTAVAFLLILFTALCVLGWLYTALSSHYHSSACIPFYRICPQHWQLQHITDTERAITAYTAPSWIFFWLNTSLC